jgi:hypothetical protein
VIAFVLLMGVVALIILFSVLNGTVKTSNTVGNIVNDGLVARSHNWVYYTNLENMTDDESLYRIRTDGSERQRVDFDHFYSD